MAPPGSIGTEGVFVAGFMGLATIFFFLALVLGVYAHILRRDDTTKNFFYTAIAFESYLMLMTMRLFVVMVVPHRIQFNNFIVYLSLFAMALTALFFRRGAVALSGGLSVYGRILLDISVYLSFVGAAGVLASGASNYLRLTEAGFGATILAGLFAIRGRLGTLLSRLMGLTGAGIVGLVVLLYWGRNIFSFKLPFGPELLLNLGAALMGILAGLQLLGMFITQTSSKTSQHNVRLRNGGEDCRLSKRERQILELLLLGNTSPIIGKALSCSEKTVRNHISHIYEKTGARNRIDLARMFPLELPRP